MCICEYPLNQLLCNMLMHFLSSSNPFHHVTASPSIILSHGCFICGTARLPRSLSGVFSHTPVSLVLARLKTQMEENGMKGEAFYGGKVGECPPTLSE